MISKAMREEAFERFWKGDSYQDVSNSLQAMGAAKEEVRDLSMSPTNKVAY